MRATSLCRFGGTRGRPYLPAGTIMDYTSSPRHQALPELQRDLDRQAGRGDTGLFSGPVVMTDKGPEPLFSGPHHDQRLREQERRRQSRQRPSFFSPQMAQMSAQTVMPRLNDGFQPDVRTDRAYDAMPEPLRAAQQSILENQADSFGEANRMMVPPPPPPSPDAPRAYTPPKVQLDSFWWPLMWSFVIIFGLMAKFGT